ncbi:Hypothetical protein CINCED_3A000213 [Cinara cedri]|nr:Hypothetical protein CINCED_3A000213 [Cinara cedri]
MAHKFKSKKQKKVKDVFNQIAKRNEELKGKTNKPPKDPKYQDVPRSLREFMKLKKLAKKDEKKGSNVKSQLYFDIGNRTQKNNQKCAFELEEKPEQINIIRESGVVVTETPVHQTTRSKLIEAKRKRQLKTKLKREKKKEKKKQKLNEETQEKEEHAIEYLKDNIEFGETVHQPPSLTVKPRKAVINDFENRPGRKDDLFLKSMLTDAGNSSKAKKIKDVILKKPSKSTLKRKAFTGKRKALSISERRIIEKERDSAVLAYRELKKNILNKVN